MKNESRKVNGLITLILAIGGIIMIAPLLWMISTSFKNKAD